MLMNKQTLVQATEQTYSSTNQHSPTSHFLLHSSPLSLCYSTRWIATECIPSTWASRPLPTLTACCYSTAMPWVRETHTQTYTCAICKCDQPPSHAHIITLNYIRSEHLCTVLMSEAISHVLSACTLTGNLMRGQHSAMSTLHSSPLLYICILIIHTLITRTHYHASHMHIHTALSIHFPLWAELLILHQCPSEAISCTNPI